MNFSRTFLFISADIACAAAAWFYTPAVRSVGNLWLFERALQWEHAVTLPFLWAVCAILLIILNYFFGSYDEKIDIRLSTVFTSVFLANLVFFLIAIACIYIADLQLQYPRSVIVLFLVLNSAASFFLKSILIFLKRFAKPLNVLLICGKSTPQSILLELRKFKDFKIKISGCVSDEIKLKKYYIYPVLGDTKKLPEIIRKTKTEVLLITVENETEKAKVLRNLPPDVIHHLKIWVMPSNWEIISGSPEYLRISDIPLVILHQGRGWEFGIKRACDFICALLLLVPAAPVMAAAAAAVALTSKGPVIYRQTRAGRYEKRFTLYKFRTMYSEYGDKIFQVSKGKKDIRLTPPGSFLRKSRLDELPQLFNVLRGEMSFIGPRPLVENEVRTFRAEVDFFTARSMVLPGLTGLAQVHGDYYTDIQAKIKYDLWYIYNYSLFLDLKIAVQTIKIIVLRKGS